MVAEAPAGSLDPNSSTYLFHEDSMVAKGKTTPAQNATMSDMTEDEDAEAAVPASAI